MLFLKILFKASIHPISEMPSSWKRMGAKEKSPGTRQCVSLYFC